MRDAADGVSRLGFDLNVVQMLSAFVELNDHERTYLRGLTSSQETFLAGREIAQTSPEQTVRVITGGWACRQLILRNGSRQIFGFLLPGDIVGLLPHPRPTDTVPIMPLTKLTCIDGTLLRRAFALDALPGLVTAIKAARWYEENCLLNHIIRLGRQSAPERIAHLLMEFRQRCQRAGLGVGERFPLPLSQEVLADALGLSSVHLNRTLQAMRRAGLIELDHGWFAILSLEKMLALSEFEHEGASGFAPA